MTPRCIAAVLLFSPAPEDLARFYREIVGIPLRLVAVTGLDPHFAVDVAHVYFSIWPATPDVPATRGAGGTAFCVDDVALEYQRLAALGVPVVFPPTATVMGIIARLKDPEGNVFELYQPPARRG